MTLESTIGTDARPLRIVVAGGGTGGHVSPGIAVLEELRKRLRVEPLWIGSRHGFEHETAIRDGIAFESIQVGKLRRYPSFRTLTDAVRIPVGILQARRHLKAFRPDIIFSTGGYVSTPVVIAGSRLRIPSITHEQTAHIGLATKINARYVDVIALSYERSRNFIGDTKASIVVTGNPVRDLVFHGCARNALDRYGFTNDLPLLYVTGGALGSRAINATVASSLPALLPHVQILHQCGPRSAHDDIETLTARATQLPLELRDRYHVVERVGAEIGDVLAATSLVVGRAGAGTIAELAAVGLPSILIPLPGAEEQRQNALYLAEAGGAILVPEHELTSELLTSTVTEVLASPSRLASMRSAAAHAAATEPAARLVDEITKLVGISPESVEDDRQPPAAASTLVTRR